MALHYTARAGAASAVGVVMIWLCKRLRHLKMYHSLEHTLRERWEWWWSHQCTVDVFAIFSPVFSLRIFYKKHAKNHTSNKPRAFKICVQLSFDKLIWYTKFHKDWSTRRQKHHWSKFFDGLVKYRTENRKTVHCAMMSLVTRSFSPADAVWCIFPVDVTKYQKILLHSQERRPLQSSSTGPENKERSRRALKRNPLHQAMIKMIKMTKLTGVHLLIHGSKYQN